MELAAQKRGKVRFGSMRILANPVGISTQCNAYRRLEHAKQPLVGCNWVAAGAVVVLEDEVRTSSKVSGLGATRQNYKTTGYLFARDRGDLAGRSIRWNAAVAAPNKSTRRERLGQCPASTQRVYQEERMEREEGFRWERADRGYGVDEWQFRVPRGATRKPVHRGDRRW